MDQRILERISEGTIDENELNCILERIGSNDDFEVRLALARALRDDGITNYNGGFSAKSFHLLFKTLKRQSQDDFDGTTQLQRLCGYCLAEVAKKRTDDLVPHVDTFLDKNLTDVDWRSRECAMYVFCAITPQCKFSSQLKLVDKFWEILAMGADDDNEQVRVSGIHSLEIVCGILNMPGVGFPHYICDKVERLVRICIYSLKNDKYAATVVCSLIASLAKGIQHTSYLSFFYPEIIETLLVVTEVKDASHFTLVHAAYDSLLKVIRYSDLQESRSSQFDVVHNLEKRLEEVCKVGFDLELEEYDALRENDLLCGHVCSILREIMTIFDKEIISQRSGALMGAFLNLIELSNSSEIVAEVISTIGSLATVLGIDFEGFFGSFWNDTLKHNLLKVEDSEVFSTSVDTIADISKAMKGHIQPFAHEIIALLLYSFSGDKVPSSDVNAIYTCIFHIGKGIGIEEFTRYLPHISKNMMQSLMKGDDNLDAIIRVYNLCFKHLDTIPSFLCPAAKLLLYIVEQVFRGSKRDPNLDTEALLLVSYLALAKNVEEFYDKDWSTYADFISSCLVSGNQSLRNAAVKAKRNIKSYMDSVKEK